MPDAPTEVRRAVGRLVSGAGELTAIALVMPLFLAGLELAQEGFVNGGLSDRSPEQTPLDRGMLVVYGVALLLMAVRARLGARAARRILPDATSADPAARERARAALRALAGPAAIRRASEWTAKKGCLLSIGLFVVLGVTWRVLTARYHPFPNPIWLTIFLATLVAMDVRWRAMIEDAADQL